jgi:hypothetical protein
LVDVLLEAFHEIGVESKGDFALHGWVVDELKHRDGELIPKSG